MKKPKEIFKNIHQHLVYNSAIVALVSFLWLVLRSGLNPKRVVYPCQQAAAANVSLFGIPLFSTVLAKVRRRQKWSLLRLFLGVSAMAVLLLASGLAYQGYQRGQRERRASKLFLNSWEAKAANTSEIFVVQHIPKPSGDNHPGVDALINLMSQKGRDFYSLISSGDVVVIKVNGQWEQRGGTNTDVLKGLIYRIVNRPGGFSGEIVVADNTQYRGGNLDWGSQNNAEDHDQSAVDVANYFSGLGHKVSTYGWINIRTTQVSEYDQRDSRDGYVYDAGFDVSYPKFSTPYNIKISLKKGIWNGSSYDSQRLKLINLPVLKTHGALGVTAALKHFVGFYSTALHSNHHWEIWNSQAILAREMVHVRMPVLHLIDAIYVGAIDAGPYISYGEATAANVLLASPDPVALDYYAGKNILHPLNPNNARTDPDYQDGSFANPCPGGGSNGYPGYPCNAFHQTLVSSRNYFNSHGYTTTMNEAEMNIHVYDFQGQPTLTPTPISTPTPTLTLQASPTPTPTITPGGPILTPTPSQEHCPRKPQGDANCDGNIDGIDYSMWLNSQCRPSSTQGCASIKADFNNDDYIDDEDYTIWFKNRETGTTPTPTSPSSTLTPIPTSPPSPNPSHCLPLGDIDCSGKVNGLDFGNLVAHWGTADPEANLNDRRVIDAADALILLGNYGE